MPKPSVSFGLGICNQTVSRCFRHLGRRNRFLPYENVPAQRDVSQQHRSTVTYTFSFR